MDASARTVRARKPSSRYVRAAASAHGGDRRRRSRGRRSHAPAHAAPAPGQQDDELCRSAVAPATAARSRQSAGNESGRRKRKCRPRAGARERGDLGDPIAPPHICSRKRSQRSRNFRKGEIRQVPRFKVRKPRVSLRRPHHPQGRVSSGASIRFHATTRRVCPPRRR